MAAKKRTAVYLRVSTGEQTLDNQRADIKRLIRARRLRLVASFEEQVSAAKARPEFDAMLDAAHRGEFETVVVWALDRLGRSMVGNLQAVLDLDRCGVKVISVNEPWLDTGGPVRSLLIAIFGWVAEQERIRMGERTKAGLERARRQGVVIGRPRRSIDIRRAESLLDKGHSLREVAKRLKGTSIYPAGSPRERVNHAVVRR